MEPDRRLSALALVPLAVIASGLFVPPLWGTLADVPAMSPWEDGVQLFWCIHLGAAALAASAGLALWRRTEPGAIAAAGASIIIAGAAFGPAWFIGFALTDRMTALVVLFAAQLVGGVALLVLAWRASGWKRWMRLIGAYAIVSVHYGCPLIIGMVNAFAGGVTFVAALVALIVLVVRSFLSD